MTNENTKAVEALEKVKEWVGFVIHDYHKWDPLYSENPGIIEKGNIYYLEVVTLRAELDRLISEYKGEK